MVLPGRESVPALSLPNVARDDGDGDGVGVGVGVGVSMEFRCTDDDNRGDMDDFESERPVRTLRFFT